MACDERQVAFQAKAAAFFRPQASRYVENAGLKMRF
jgi:hypothetical protein